MSLADAIWLMERNTGEIIGHQNIRAHNVVIAYRCTLPEGFKIDNLGRSAATPRVSQMV